MSSDQVEWIPLRQAVAEIAPFYEKAMGCTVTEAADHAWEAIWRRLEHGAAVSRSPRWYLISEYADERDPSRLDSDSGQTIDPGFWHILRLGGDTLDWVAGEFSCARESTPDASIPDFPTVSYGFATDVEVQRSGLPLIADSWWGAVPLASDQRIRALLPPRGGRPRKHDWDRAVCHVAAAAAMAERAEVRQGYGAQADVTRMLLQWFSDNREAEPAPSEVAIRAKMIVEELERIRK